MQTTSIGNKAEAAVAGELKNQGYQIIDRNWKTRRCEIDLIAQKDKTIYFVEVKFRSSTAQGDGFEYIGPQKIKRLHFAAEIWVQNNKWTGDYGLLASSVSSNMIIDIIEIDCS